MFGEFVESTTSCYVAAEPYGWIAASDVPINYFSDHYFVMPRNDFSDTIEDWS